MKQQLEGGELDSGEETDYALAGYGNLRACAEGGVLGILPGLVGVMQATEVIKLIFAFANRSWPRVTDRRAGHEVSRVETS